MSETIKRVCSLCEAMCGLSIQVADDRSMTIRANRDDLFSKGAFCPKSQGLKDLYWDTDRLRKPLKRVEGEFQEISWDQAFSEIGERIADLQAAHGTSAMASYVGNPNAHNFGNLLMLPTFFKALRTPNKFSATSVDQLPHMLVAYLMFGHQLLLPIADIDHARYVLIIGANPAVSNGSLLSAAGLSSRIKALSEGQGKVVVLDPRYTETASLATEHHFIRPGMDAFFLSGIVHLLLHKHGLKSGLPASMLKGVEQLAELFAAIDLEEVAAISGVSVAVMEGIARDLHSFEPALCYGRMGVSTQAFGTLCQWMINLINIITGNFDKRGGVLFTKPAVDVVDLMAKSGNRGSFARRKSRVRGLPEFGGEFPSATLADEILTPGKGQVRGLITIAGNPVLSLPNGQKLEEALATLDLYVAIDIYRNETTRFAHYILPPSSPLEHSHFDLIFNALATRNIVRYSPTVIPADEGSLEDWEILLEIWSRLPRRWWEARPLVKSLARGLGTDRILDIGLRTGPYRQSGLTLKRLKAHADGIDLGPLEPSLPGRLYTKDKRIDLLPETLLKAWHEFRAMDLWQKPDLPSVEKQEWTLIGRRSLKSNNSWMHNLPSLKRSKDPCVLIMNDGDAKAQGIDDGASVRISTAVGSVKIPVSVTDRIMPGVVSIPHGWGHHRSGTNQRLAQKSPGVSINDILDDKQVDAFSGNACLNGQRVRIEALASE